MKLKPDPQQGNVVGEKRKVGIEGLRKGLKGQKEEWEKSTTPRGRELIKN